MTQFNNLTSAEAERLAILIEECGEVAQAAAKILRHGYLSYNPTLPDTSQDNRQMLERECGDLAGIMHVMVEAGDTKRSNVEYYRLAKLVKLPKWTHHQPDSQLPAEAVTP